MTKTRNTVIRVAVYCLLAVFFIAIVNLQIRMNNIKDEIEENYNTIVEIEDQVAKYNILLSQKKDADYYERRAREEGFHFKDEIVFYNEYED